MIGPEESSGARDIVNMSCVSEESFHFLNEIIEDLTSINNGVIGIFIKFNDEEN